MRLLPSDPSLTYPPPLQKAAVVLLSLCSVSRPSPVLVNLQSKLPDNPIEADLCKNTTASPANIDLLFASFGIRGQVRGVATPALLMP